MDKNTLWGLLLMGVIFFGFMYCNKPSQEELEAQRRAQESSQAAVPAATTSAANTVDTLDLTQATALAEALRQVGTMDDNGRYNLNNETFNLQLDSINVSGQVYVAGGKKIEINELLAGTSAASAEARTAAVKAVNDLIAKAQKYRGLARNLGGEETETVLENDLMKVTLASRGAMVKSVVLKKYQTELTEEPSDIELFQGDNDGYGFVFTTADQRIDTREFNFTAVEATDSSVVMSLELGDGASWGIRYAIRPDNYLLGMEIVQKGADKFLPASTASIDFNWHQTMARNEKGKVFEQRNSAIYYKYVGDSPDDLNANKDDSKQLNGRVKWVAFKNQFFSSVIVPRQYFATADLNSVDLKTEKYLKDMTMAATVPYTVADGSPAAFDFYFGPNEYSRLSDLDDELVAEEDLGLTRLIPLGWGFFRYINTWVIIPVFNVLSSFISNYGIIILLLTIFIKLIIFPFTFKSYKSQARMRLLQPEIKEINDKYPGQENAMKRQQETMALYSRTGASPFSGCLPMLFQMPVLIAMFSFFPSAIELRGQSFLWAHDLSAPDYILTLPFTIPFYGNGVSLFCLLMTVVNVVYMHINMQNQPANSAMPGMKWMTYMMPVMFLFFFNDYASGLSYYYFLSLLITIIQTWAFRRCMDEDKVRAEMLANAKKPKKKSGWMARLEEAQRQQQAALRQQQAGKGKRR